MNYLFLHGETYIVTYLCVCGLISVNMFILVLFEPKHVPVCVVGR